MNTSIQMVIVYPVAECLVLDTGPKIVQKLDIFSVFWTYWGKSSIDILNSGLNMPENM